MITITFLDQLGNQMFQYALGRHLQILGRKVLYNTDFYSIHPDVDFALSRLFQLDIPISNKYKSIFSKEHWRWFLNGIRGRLLGHNYHVINEDLSLHSYNNSVFDIKNGRLKGWWQSEKYFSPIEDILRKDFSFPQASGRNLQLADEMSNTESVSIHVRRGDYIESGFNVLDEDYYYRAMSYFLSKYGDAHFYVFSDDIEWCRTHLQSENISFIDWNTGKDSPWDMYLMSKCKHNIIANSTFSWWGAWLNQNKGKEVIAPKVWIDIVTNPDIFCDNWILL